MQPVIKISSKWRKFRFKPVVEEICRFAKVSKIEFQVWLTWAHDNVIKRIFFHVTGILLEESGGFPLTNASDEELWCFLWSAPEQTVEQTIEMSVIWDAMALIMTSV